MVGSKSEVEVEWKSKILRVDKDTLSLLPQSSAMRRTKLKFDPQGFVIENERLEQKIAGRLDALRQTPPKGSA